MIKIVFIAGFVAMTTLFGTYKYSPETIRTVERAVYNAVRGPIISFLTSNGYNKKNSKTAYGIHPILDKKISAVLREARAEGIDLRIVSGYRSFSHQQALFNKGRTTKGGKVTNAVPGLSYHNYGWAVDVCEYKNGKPYWKSKHWNRIGEIGKEHGLVWGGDWTRLVDRPHLQLSTNDIIFSILLK